MFDTLFYTFLNPLFMKTFKRVSQGLIFLSLIFGFKLANAQCTPCKETVTEHYFRKVLCDWQGTDGARDVIR